MTDLAEEFSLAKDDRVVVVKALKDFKILRERPWIMAATMPNPIRMPNHRVEIANIMRATYRPTEAERINDIPSEIRINRDALKESDFDYCIKGTGAWLMEAFFHAGREPAALLIRQNSDYPNRAVDKNGVPMGPHTHDITGAADILGNTTVFYEGSKQFPGRSYSLPRHHITVFRHILHGAGELEHGKPRLTMFCA